MPPIQAIQAQVLPESWLKTALNDSGDGGYGVIAGRWASAFVFAAFSLIGSAADDFGTAALAQVQRSGEPSQVSQPNLTGDWGGAAVLSRAHWHHFYAQLYQRLSGECPWRNRTWRRRNRSFSAGARHRFAKAFGLGGRQIPHPCPDHQRAFFQSDVSRQHFGRVKSRNWWTRGTALFVVVRTERLQ